MSAEFDILTGKGVPSFQQTRTLINAVADELEVPVHKSQPSGLQHSHPDTQSNAAYYGDNLLDTVAVLLADDAEIDQETKAYILQLFKEQFQVTDATS